MNVLINHCWCSDSNWGGQYNCRVIVSLEQFASIEDVHKRKRTPDWNTLLDEVKDKNDFHNDTWRLKPEVTQWLKVNVKDYDCDEHKQGWAVGTDKYNSKANGLDFSIFFQRATDARKFIKHWSIHKNPVDYLNYFRDLRWKLDTTNGKMKRAPLWNN